MHTTEIVTGTTSACAENTNRCHIAGNERRNYLRVRGEYRSTMISRNWVSELPPRARRILFVLVMPVDDFGTTSACAENTFC